MNDFSSDTRSQVLGTLLSAHKFIVATHEHPDGDALGSLVAATRLLRAIGKDVVAVVAPTDLPIPREYKRLVTDDIQTVLPVDVGQRTALVLDCGNADRVSMRGILDVAAQSINVDHHHDNTRFADVNHVEPEASCTAEMLWSLAPDLGSTLDRLTAEALYIGLITDTGRFMYENVSPRSHVMAADLLAVGVDTYGIYREVFEDIPWQKLALVGRALARVCAVDDGQLIFALLRREDYEASGAEDAESEGIIDMLRSVAGTKVAAFAREVSGEPTSSGTRRTKVSLRSTDGSVDVSAIARAAGGGGHPQAAGFTTELDEFSLIEFLRSQLNGPTAPSTVDEHPVAAATLIPTESPYSPKPPQQPTDVADSASWQAAADQIYGPPAPAPVPVPEQPVSASTPAEHEVAQPPSSYSYSAPPSPPAASPYPAVAHDSGASHQPLAGELEHQQPVVPIDQELVDEMFGDHQHSVAAVPAPTPTPPPVQPAPAASAEAPQPAPAQNGSEFVKPKKFEGADLDLPPVRRAQPLKPGK